MPALRIASLLASATEILYGLGLGEQVVAVSHECDFPTEVFSKPRVTRTHVATDANSRAIDHQVHQMLGKCQALYEIDLPALEAVKPDLIVTQAQCDVCAVRYQDVRSAVEHSPVLNTARVVALNPLTLPEILRDVAAVGEAAAVPDRAAEYVSRLQARVDAVRAVTIHLSDLQRPRVICIEWIDPLMVAANWMPKLVQLAGGQNGLTQNGVHSTYTDWAEVVAYQPEVLVIAPCGLNLERTLSELPTLKALAGWNTLPAVQNSHVYACDGNAYFNRSGPRMIDTLEILAHLIQPSRFATPASCSSTETIWRRVV